MDEEEGAQDPTKVVIKDSVSRKESPKKVAKEITLDEEDPTEDVTLEVSLDSTEEGNDGTIIKENAKQVVAEQITLDEDEEVNLVEVTNIKESSKVVAEEIMIVEEDCTKEPVKEITLTRVGTVAEVTVEDAEEGELSDVVTEEITLDGEDSENKTAYEAVPEMNVETGFLKTGSSKDAVKEVPNDVVHVDEEQSQSKQDSDGIGNDKDKKLSLEVVVENNVFTQEEDENSLSHETTRDQHSITLHNVAEKSAEIEVEDESTASDETYETTENKEERPAKEDPAKDIIKEKGTSEVEIKAAEDAEDVTVEEGAPAVEAALPTPKPQASFLLFSTFGPPAPTSQPPSPSEAPTKRVAKKSTRPPSKPQLVSEEEMEEEEEERERKRRLPGLVGSPRKVARLEVTLLEEEGEILGEAASRASSPLLLSSPDKACSLEEATLL